jgi:hypothetical protein
MAAIVTLGIHLEKMDCAVHGVGATGKPVPLHPQAPYPQLLESIATVPHARP